MEAWIRGSLLPGYGAYAITRCSKHCTEDPRRAITAILQEAMAQIAKNDRFRVEKGT